MYVRASFLSLFTAAKHADSIRENRRLSPREETAELAELVVDLTGRRITCIVHNISEGGAMVEACANPLPERTTLICKNWDINKSCRVVWSDGKLSGLEFVAD